MRVSASWSRFGPSFFCVACGTQLKDVKGLKLVHPTHRGFIRDIPIKCSLVGKVFDDPFRWLELKEANEGQKGEEE